MTDVKMPLSRHGWLNLACLKAVGGEGGKRVLKCPFCNEDDFDIIGLKIHLLAGHCKVFDNVHINWKQPQNAEGKEPL